MFASVVISKLSVNTVVPTPETLEDLAVKFTEPNIYVIRETSADTYLQHSSYYDKIKNRIKRYELNPSDSELTAVFDDIRSGESVVINVTQICR